MISWLNRKKTFIALSSSKVEYTVANIDGYEAIWLCKFPAGLFDQELDPTVIIRVVSNSIRIQSFTVGPST